MVSHITFLPHRDINRRQAFQVGFKLSDVLDGELADLHGYEGVLCRQCDIGYANTVEFHLPFDIFEL